MKVTQLLALNNKSSHMTERILLNKLYLGDSDNVVYEFLNDLNDELSLELTEKDIGKLFVLLTTQAHTTFNKSFKNRTYDIYLNYQVEDL